MSAGPKVRTISQATSQTECELRLAPVTDGPKVENEFGILSHVNRVLIPTRH